MKLIQILAVIALSGIFLISVTQLIIGGEILSACNAILSVIILTEVIENKL